MDRINATKFQSLITHGFDIEDKIIENDVFLGVNIESQIRIKNCVFVGHCQIADIIFDYPIEIINCEFKGDISIHGVSFYKQFTFSNTAISGNLKISNCSFDEVTFDGIYNSIEFKGNINEIPNRNNNVIFKSGSYKSLTFSCKEFNCPITFSDGVYDLICFSKNKLNNSLTLDGANLNIAEFHIQSADFFDRVNLANCKISGTTYFHKVSFTEQVIINDTFCSNSISLSNTIAKQNFSINYKGNISSLYISTCDFQNNFNCDYFSFEKPENLFTENGLSCTIAGSNKGNIIFENISIPTINLSGVNFANVIFKNLESHLIIISDFYNQGKVTFADLKLVYKSALIIFDSNINYTEFVNINFRKFEELVIAKSEVSNIVLSNSIFPRDIQIETKNPVYGYRISLDVKINDNVYYRESYRQLKLAMEKQGNRSLALVFKAKEMHYLREELNFGWDKILLYLNYYSNNHGLSWSRGLIFTIFISWLMFVLYEFTLLTPSFLWAKPASMNDFNKAFDNGLNAFFTFLASFPLFKNLDTDKLNWRTNLVFLLSRIFIGYGLYQTITAFRKFGSKS